MIHKYCVVFCAGIQRGRKIHFTLHLSWVGRLSKSLWLGTDQYCLENEGAAAGVCAEEDGEGLIFTVTLSECYFGEY